jgi:hypothetical protein
MHRNRTDGEPLQIGPPPTPNSVQGWGLCDVLRVELEPVQLASCLDELRTLEGVLREALEHARHVEADAEREIARRVYELRVLDAMRRNLEPCRATETPVLFGPGGLVMEIVTGATGDAIAALGETFDAGSHAGADRRDELVRRGRLARAWIATFVDVHAVVSFSFDPEFDLAGWA